MKSLRRPVFEDAWSCSDRCLRAKVATAFRRESTEGGVRRTHQHRLPIGLILLEQKVITQEQLQDVLRAQKSTGGGRIGDWLMKVCGVEEAQITRALARQWSCPVFPLAEFDPETIARTAPLRILERSAAVPLRLIGTERLQVGFEHAISAAATFAIERTNRIRVESGLAVKSELRAVQRMLCKDDFIPETFHACSELAEVRERVVRCLSQLQPVASRLSRVHEFYWLRMWLEDGALVQGRAGFPQSLVDVCDHVFTSPDC